MSIVKNIFCIILLALSAFAIVEIASTIPIPHFGYKPSVYIDVKLFMIQYGILCIAFALAWINQDFYKLKQGKIFLAINIALLLLILLAFISQSKGFLIFCFILMILTYILSIFIKYGVSLVFSIISAFVIYPIITLLPLIIMSYIDSKNNYDFIDDKVLMIFAISTIFLALFNVFLIIYSYRLFSIKKRKSL